MLITYILLRKRPRPRLTLCLLSWDCKITVTLYLIGKVYPRKLCYIHACSVYVVSYIAYLEYTCNVYMHNYKHFFFFVGVFELKSNTGITTESKRKFSHVMHDKY